ncbi:MAG: 4-phosphoerythronate dehydrogenase PdxB [Verrucomicrobia bacterium]|jgi:erythronate-4-phosphate dehydrogenase|nr:4-phosphoerythronate dehydrogenase PdxB [Verrucomicrobiota bacterium]
MKTVCCRNMPYVDEAFRTLGETSVLEGRSITAEDVHDADLMAIRSTTPVNADLLEGSSVRFVGTATIGTDHLDIDYLERKGIHWCFSPGCNANSVSEYLTAALLCLADRHGFTLHGKTLGVIGVGNVGKRVVEKAETLGLRVLQNDPPRARAEEQANAFVDLNTLLAESDIVTTHVPITRDGQDATYHMADAGFFNRMRPGTIFINAARGPVVATDDLLSAIKTGQLSHAILDTWEGEPNFRKALLDAVDIGTPHIAGHSFEGKVMGTVMVYREACRVLGVDATWTPDDLLPEPVVPKIIVDASTKCDEAVLWEIVRQVYSIEEDDARLRTSTENRTAHFDSLRKNYPVRREFRFTKVVLQNAPKPLCSTLSKLGFKVMDSA